MKPREDNRQTPPMGDATRRWAAAVESTAPAGEKIGPKDPAVVPGATIHTYVVEQRIGEGGMGAVWRVRQKMLKVPRAMKVLKPGVASVERFEKEMEMLAMIKHDNVVKVIEGGVLPDGSLFYVMEYVEGRSLEADIAKHRGQRPQWEYIREVGLQICDGLAAIHERGIIHRDMKPANCMLSPDISQPVRVKIVDLGVARRAAVRRSVTTSVGMFIGSAAYASPEQAAGETENLTYGSDVYSVGIILYELATGVVPHTHEDGDDRAAMLRRRVVGILPPPPSASVRPGTLPPEVDEVIARALQPDPRDRFQSISELAEALRAIPATPPRPRAPRPSQSLPTVPLASESSSALTHVLASQSSPGLPHAVPTAATSSSRTIIAVRPSRRAWPGLVALALLTVLGATLASSAVRTRLFGAPARPTPTTAPPPPQPAPPPVAAPRPAPAPEPVVLPPVEPEPDTEPPPASPEPEPTPTRPTAPTAARYASLAEQVQAGCAKVRAGEHRVGTRILWDAFKRSSESETDFELCRCLGDGFAGKKDLPVALQWYRRALAVRPADRDALAGAAGAAAKLGYSERAVELYRRLVAVDPTDAAALAYLAVHDPEPPPDPFLR